MKRTFVFVSVFALVAVVATGAIVASKRTADLTSTFIEFGGQVLLGIRQGWRHGYLRARASDED